MNMKHVSSDEKTNQEKQHTLKSSPKFMTLASMGMPGAASEPPKRVAIVIIGRRLLNSMMNLRVGESSFQAMNQNS
jgi:hypothetical protein